ncbi:MAG: hypothetical protein J1F68_01045 [Clostridiales bacterium]|nr:hypothetical protein [Clostridiales bacterium]
MKISEKLGLKKSQLELDFYDYEIELDTYMFFDPYYISRKEDAFLAECNEYIETFFNRFLYLLQYDEERAFELFNHLGEVNEICLGMSRGKPAGKGVGRVNARTIFEAIKKSCAINDGVAEHIEDLRLFVEGVDKDKVSDMVANIIKYPLIKYTKEQCELLGIKLTNAEVGYYWNKTATRWDRGHHETLVIDGKRYLLFPKNLVSDAKYYNAQEFLNQYVLEFLKEKNLKEDTHLVRKTYDKNGSLKNAKVCKKDIVADYESRGEFLTKNWLSRFTKENPDVLSKFKNEIIQKISYGELDDISDEDIEEIIDNLIEALKSIPPGSEHATRYHRLISGILELLFYPYIAHPKIEKEINDGRKRIDIVFNNIAESGFLHYLGTTYNVPCSLIMVECKNYSKDIANPELDQMSGRFSANRGKFGIICCRYLDDPQKFIQCEMDTVKDGRGWIIHITDEEIIELLQQRKIDNTISDFLLKKYDEINNS